MSWALIALSEAFFLECAVPPEGAAPSAAELDRFVTETAALLESGCRPPD